MEDELLPFEKETIRIYYYYFEGKKDPLIIEAYDRELADQYLAAGLRSMGLFGQVTLINTKVTTPIFGVTEKQENGIEYVWAGLRYSKNGWLSKNEFDKIDVEK